MELLLCVCWLPVCLLAGLGRIIGALLCTSDFLHPRHSTVPCIMQNTLQFFALSAMDVGHIDLVLLSISNVRGAVLCLPRFWPLRAWY